MGFMWLSWVLLVVFIAWVVLRWAPARGNAAGVDQESPEQILKRRYARGEIDKEEYDRRLNDLRR
jgi:putative membrane protein